MPNNDSNDVTVIDVATHTPHASSPIAVGPDPIGTGANFITPNIIASTGGPLIIANDAALEAAGFRSFVPFNGGTLRLSGDWTTTRHLSMLAGNGTIDTNGFNATIAGNVVNNGLLNKTGAGTLTLTETSTATHARTAVYAGTLVVNGTHSAPVTMWDGTAGWDRLGGRRDGERRHRIARPATTVPGSFARRSSRRARAMFSASRSMAPRLARATIASR